MVSLKYQKVQARKEKKYINWTENLKPYSSNNIIRKVKAALKIGENCCKLYIWKGTFSRIQGLGNVCLQL